MQTQPFQQQAMDLASFCRQYSIGRVKTYELINAGELTAVKVGRKTLIPVNSAESWFGSLPKLRAKPPLGDVA
jgi:excisionase family DNA binding protein